MIGHQDKFPAVEIWMEFLYRVDYCQRFLMDLTVSALAIGQKFRNVEYGSFRSIGITVKQYRTQTHL